MSQLNDQPSVLAQASTPAVRKRSWKRKLAAIAFGLSISFLLGEVALRIGGYSPEYVNALATFHTYDSELGFIGRRGFEGIFHTPEFDIDVRYTEEGFRKIGEPKSNADRTLFVLGDSFAWGWGVEETATLAGQISKQFPNWNLKNYALPGYGTLQQQLVFERFIRKQLRDQDALLILHYGNDFDDSLGKHLTNVPRASVTESGTIDVVPPPTSSWSKELKNKLKQSSYLFNFAAYTTDFLKYSSRQKKFLDEKKQTSLPIAESEETAPLDPDDPRMIVMHEYLSKIKSACDERRIPVLMVRVPFREEFGEARAIEAEKNEPFAAYRPSVHSITTELKIPLIDLHDSFKDWKSNHDGRLTFPIDLHWNEIGHDLAATSVEQFLETHLEPDTRVADEKRLNTVSR